MDDRKLLCEQAAFACEMLGPFYLNDPAQDAEKIGPLFSAFAELDVDAAAGEWPFALGRSFEARSALALMSTGAREACGPEVSEDLTWEYRRLFVGPGKKPAPPWGSVYTDRECVVFGATTLELRAWMRERGIARAGDASEPEDHIGLMLLLASWIASNRPELLDEYLRDHLLTWAGHFLEQLEAAAEHPFYEGLARLTALTLEGMRQAFDLSVSYPRFYR